MPRREGYFFLRPDVRMSCSIEQLSCYNGQFFDCKKVALCAKIIGKTCFFSAANFPDHDANNSTTPTELIHTTLQQDFQTSGLPDFRTIAPMLMMTDEDFMRAALNEARAAADEGEVPIGAVVVYENRIIGRGRNACERLNDATAHAEMIAITAASQALSSWRLEACTLYVTLEPCPMCMGACLNARIKRVVYGALEPKAGACGSVVDLRAPPGFNHKIDAQSGVLASESATLLKNFFRALRERKS
jgi:tRNA(adenine34) deaminase